MKPYIGITGFMSRNEVIMARDMFLRNSQYCDYLLMVGVLVSLKTIYGHSHKRPNRYPELRNIAEIFIPNPSLLSLIHYNSNNTENLFVQLMALTELIRSPQFDGFQLNIPWPDELELATYKSHYPDKKIVLQIGSRAFEMIKNSPEKLVERLDLYVGLIDHVLLDMSGGEGKLLDAEELRKYLWAIKNAHFRNMGIGVAGGLGLRTMHLLYPLLEEFSDLSIDAERGLRNKNDHLDMSFVEEYLIKFFNSKYAIKASEFFRKNIK